LAQPVYSTRFIARQGLNGTATYVVPAGFRAVVRDVDAYCDNSGAGGTLFLHGSAGQTIWHLSLAAFATTDGMWRGRQVVEQLESFDVTTDTRTDVTVSGYLLSLP
jgi:hypothetical protein